MNCQNCGTVNEDNCKFCASCGQPLTPQTESRGQHQNNNQNGSSYQSNGHNPGAQSYGHGAQPSQQDIEKNKVFAIIAYFVFFVPLIAAKDSPYARYHANQGLTLLIFYVGAAIVHGFLFSIIFSTFLWSLFSIITLIFSLIYLGLLIIGIMGIINAVNGKCAPIPLIGRLLNIIK